MRAPPTQSLADPTVGPLQRISPEPARELRASGMRWRSPQLSPRRSAATCRQAGCQSKCRGRRSAGLRQAASGRGCRTRCQHPAIHDRDLSEQVRPSSRGVNTPSPQLSPRSPCAGSRTPCCGSLRSSTAATPCLIVLMFRSLVDSSHLSNAPQIRVRQVVNDTGAGCATLLGICVGANDAIRSARRQGR
jgi:hypothetical protein